MNRVLPFASSNLKITKQISKIHFPETVINNITEKISNLSSILPAIEAAPKPNSTYSFNQI